MPQLAMFAHRHPVEWVARYWTNPLTPDDPNRLFLYVKDQAGGVMDECYAVVQPEVTWEQVAAHLDASWDAFLFGEIGNQHAVARPIVRRWRKEAEIRRGGIVLRDL